MEPTSHELNHTAPRRTRPDPFRVSDTAEGPAALTYEIARGPTNSSHARIVSRHTYDMAIPITTGGWPTGCACAITGCATTGCAITACGCAAAGTWNWNSVPGMVP